MSEHMIDWTHAAPRSATTTGEPPLVTATTSAPFVGFLERARRSASLLLVVNDSTRSTATTATLRALQEQAPDLLRRARVLVATGSHGFGETARASYEEQLELKAHGIASVSWHDARADALVELGGISVHPWIAEAEHMLAIGSVEPHYFAGLTGAHKTITIGCVSRRDIERNHERALDPATRILTLDGNPVFDGIAAMAEAVVKGRDVLALNQIVHDGVIIDAAVGDPVATVRSLRAGVLDVYASVFDRTFDVLHLRVPPPLGRSLYQADKALKNHDLAVRDGGTIILEAACEEGLGQDAFIELLRAAPTFAGTLALIEQRGYRLGDHKAVLLRRLMDERCRGVRVLLVSPTLDPSSLERTSIELFRSVEEALASMGSDGPMRGLRVEDAAMCVSILEPSAGARDANEANARS